MLLKDGILISVLNQIQLYTIILTQRNEKTAKMLRNTLILLIYIANKLVYRKVYQKYEYVGKFRKCVEKVLFMELGSILLSKNSLILLIR